MAITATQNDGVSLNDDKISYDLAETDVEIITSGRRRIPAHSGILVSFFLFGSFLYIRWAFYFLCTIEHFHFGAYFFYFLFKNW